MGTYIDLSVGKLDIDSGKNNIFQNHTKLFQKEDYDVILDSYYEDGQVFEKIGAKKNILEVKNRIELLGYSLNNCKNKYNKMKKDYEFLIENKINISFNDIYLYILSLNVNKTRSVFSLFDEYCSSKDYMFFISDDFLKDYEKYKKLIKVLSKFQKVEKEYEFRDFIYSINPYIILRILAENPNNKDFFVEWNYQDVVKEGWVKEEEIKKGLDKSDKILIVTEGTSDSSIIKRTLCELYTDIYDFFEFIDMSENYPFTGVGNLANLCKGLVKIHTLNNIIVIFDNDTAGNEMYNSIKGLRGRPKNLVFCKLPDSDKFSKFDTIGTSGKRILDINGKAVAIECFLDFNSISSSPIVRWNNYKKNLDQYQGELVNKESYSNAFYSANLKDGSYNCEKLRMLIDFFIDSWISVDKE